MKKIMIVILLLAGLQSLVYADKSFVLGSVETRMGTIKITHVQSKRSYISLEIVDELVILKLYLPKDLRDVRKLIKKFEDWHKIAVENNSTLNKKLGELSAIYVEFITFNNKYEFAFVGRNGMRLMIFDIETINQLKEIISDENIDLVINEEKRRQQKEDDLFQ